MWIGGFILDGLILNLFKRKLYKPKSDLDNYDDIIFGYYDGVIFTHPEKWSDFGPQGVDKLLVNKNKEINSPLKVWEDFSNIYPIKLLFPKEQCRKEICSYGFTYSLWEKIGEDSDEEQAQFPLFGALLLNVTENFIKDAKTKNCSTISLVAEKIHTAMAHASISLEDMNCGLFQSIGYYDYALLFHCKNWSIIYQIADELKNKVEDEDFLSSSYLLLGACGKQEALENISLSPDFNMSIRINLRENISVQVFKNAFFEQLQRHLQSNIISQEELDFWKDHASFYQISGASDCIITTDSLSSTDSACGVKYVIKQFLTNGLFSPHDKPGNSFFKDYIISIRTSARYPMDSYTPLNIGQDETSDTNQNVSLPISQDAAIITTENVIDTTESVIDKLNKWITTDLADLVDDSAYVRRIHGQQQMYNQYQNLVHDNHVFDIRLMLEPVYEIFLDNLKVLTAEQRKQQDLKNICPENQSLIGKPDYKKTIYKLLGEFRNHVGSFQDALQLSDRYFIESARINHPSIGSSTKLMIAYNQMINQFVKTVQTGLGKSDDFQYRFLVVCGGCDEIQSYNLSRNVPLVVNNHIEEKRLIIMQLPERSIFDVCGTIIRSLHETWHFCGDRKRKERNYYIISAVSYDLAVYISNFIMWDREIFMEEIHKTSIDYLKKNEQDRVSTDQQLSLIYEDNLRNLREQISHCLASELISAYNKMLNSNEISDLEREEKLYSRYSFEFLRKITCDVLMGEGDNSFIEQTCMNLMKAENTLFTQVNTILPHGIPDFNGKIRRYKYSKYLDKRYLQYITRTLEFICGNSIVPHDSAMKDWLGYFPSNLVRYTYDQLKDIYQEALPDYMTFRTLTADGTIDLEDYCIQYILTFVYNVSDIDMIDAALACNYTRAIRIGVILDYCFNESIENLNLNVEKLKVAYLKLNNYDSTKTDELMEHVNSCIQRLWSIYYNEKHTPLVRELKNYLTEVFNKNRVIYEKTSCINDIQQIFHRMLSAELHDDVIDAVALLENFWCSQT